MSLRILFADDSMTAQNMGKKILSEAGYDVVAVSNGAAAVKKIAEQKPDIIILDVYMPGYSGLEVCEKVRGSLDTLKTPVLLTVGKMEPYKPEDANRVKADGVIIKPFEASDLLAIVKKFEERIGQTQVPPMVEQTVRLEQKYQEDAIEEAQMQHHATGKTGIQPMVEVPDHMAGSAAFTDMLGSESSIAPQHFAVNTPAAAFETSVIVPAPPVPSAEYELPVSWKEEPQAEPISVAPEQSSSEIVATPVEASAEPIASPTAPEADVTTLPAPASEPEISHPQFIPVFEDPEPEPAAYELVHTAVAPTGELEIPREPALLQETAEETTRSTVADHVEPGLMTTLSQEIDPQTVASPSGGPEARPELEIAPANSYSAPLPAVEATSEVTDADFEARVAAAMAAYSHTTDAAPAHVSENESAPVASAEAAAKDTVYTVHAVAVPEPTPSFEYHPPVRTPEAAPVDPVAPAVAAIADPVAQPAPAVSEPVAPQPEAVHSVVTAGLEVAAVAAAAETGAEHHTIAQAVHRVMERIKPELVEEIMRELRSKK